MHYGRMGGLPRRRTAVWAALGLALTTELGLFAAPSPPGTRPLLTAFPGAEGFGALAVGGRGGKVLLVTHLNDAGPGSLRAACEVEGPRTVIFRVSGTIELKRTLQIRQPFITVAGQTAPGDGICLKNFGLQIAAHDVILRHLRCRPGDSAGKELDALSLSGGAHRVMVDHCSVSWSTDEALSVSGADISDVTVQWCVIAESLNQSVHQKGAHGYGSLLRADGNVTFHHNLYAHHNSRNPRPGTYGERPLLLDFRNQVIYDWGSRAGYSAEDPARLNYMGNYLKPGPSSRTPNIAFQVGGPATKMFVADNVLHPGGGPDTDPWKLIAKSALVNQAAQPFEVAPVRTDPAAMAFQRVLDTAGAIRPHRDAVDARIVAQVRAGAGRLINSQSEVGGWPVLKSDPPPADADDDRMPDAWEKLHRLKSDNAADANADADGDGYTNLEEFLNATDPRRPEQ